ncbi:MAG: heparinase, partial [Novosphingobium sp.]
MSDAGLYARSPARNEAAGHGPAIPLAGGDEGGLVNGSDDLRAIPGEVVEPGRALALADFAPPAIGAGERLLRLAYRLGV